MLTQNGQSEQKMRVKSNETKTRKATNRQLMNSLRNILIEYSKILIIKLTLSPDSIFFLKKKNTRIDGEWRERERRAKRRKESQPI